MPDPTRPPFRPWRSVPLAVVVAAGALAVGVPLFLRMPPWVDVTHYDVIARTLLRGGVLYRDVFDTNLPGMPWALAAVRAALGWSYEALRAVDLVVMAGAVALLTRFVRRCGAPPHAGAWFVAACALFYPYLSEFCHVQRDPWALLPAGAAALLRAKRVAAPRSAVPEGALWGVAVWLKPHAAVPALAVWLVSVVPLARAGGRRAVRADFAQLILGGLLAGAPGVAFLVWSGAWPHFLDVFLNWNPAYVADPGPLGARLTNVLTCFRPWGLVHLFALPLAVRAVWQARAPNPTPADALVLAALYLGWLAQAALLQRAFDYVQVPVALLAFAVIAGRGWCFGFVALVWFALAGAAAHVVDGEALRALDRTNDVLRVEKHPLFDATVMRHWPACVRGGGPELRDALGHFSHLAWGTNWTDLTRTAEFLRPLGLRPGELNCWHDTTHPLYLILDLDPATRFLHYGTAFGIAAKADAVAAEVRASRQRYVVSDLLRTTRTPEALAAPDSWRAGDPLPVWLSAAERARFPWNQPVVFRSGRYVVHRIDVARALGEIRVPKWDELPRE